MSGVFGGLTRRPVGVSLVDLPAISFGVTNFATVKTTARRVHGSETDSQDIDAELDLAGYSKTVYS